jgi:nicotinamide-nucleotide amidase
MNPTLEIFSQGEEIVTGQVIDTNAAWLSEQATQLGFSVTRHTAVGDKLDELIGLLRDISRRADCCICTGGLGPTQDDLTAEAVAQAFNLQLTFDEIAYSQMERFFSQRNRIMPASNRKQALLPKGALRLDNEWGTAPGFAVERNNCWLIFLPGVPSEMRPMFLEKVLPILPKRFSLQPSKLITIKTFGLGESEIQQRIDPIDIPRCVQLGFRASLNDVQTKLLFPFNYPENAMQDLIKQITDTLGNHVFLVEWGNQNLSLADVVDQLMTKQKQTLTVIETLSQGFLASLCIGTNWLLEARYGQNISTLSNAINGFRQYDDIIEIGKQLAEYTRKESKADIALVQLCTTEEVTTDNNHKITVHHVLLGNHGFSQTTNTIYGNIKQQQNQAALQGLDLLRRYLSIDTNLHGT